MISRLDTQSRRVQRCGISHSTSITLSPSIAWERGWEGEKKWLIQNSKRQNSPSVSIQQNISVLKNEVDGIGSLVFSSGTREARGGYNLIKHASPDGHKDSTLSPSCSKMKASAGQSCIINLHLLLFPGTILYFINNVLQIIAQHFHIYFLPSCVSHTFLWWSW